MCQTDDLLFQSVKESDSHALKILIDKYTHQLLLYCQRYIERRDIAEEIIADIFIMLWEKREQIIITSSFKAYLYAAVRNYSIDYIRSRESKVILMDPVGGSVDEPYVDITESAGIESAYDQRYRQLEQMVSVLPQRRKKIFLLYRNGHGISDIATILGLSKKTVRNCIGKAVKQLQRLVINYNHLPLYILFCISFTVGPWSLWAI